MEIAIIIALILLNGLFAMSEIAVVSARKSSLNNEAKRGNKNAEAALKLTTEPNRFLSTVQVGITLIGILTGIYSGGTLAGDLVKLVSKFGIPITNTTLFISQTVIVVLVTYLSIIFGELVPKKIGMNSAEKVAKAIARPMNILSNIVSPFVWILSKSTTVVSNLLGITEADAKVTEEEIKSMIQEGTEDGEVQEVEQKIVERVFNLGDRDLESIMTHRSDIVWLDINMTNEQINGIVHNNLFGVYPVADKNLDNILGIVYLKDLFGRIDKEYFKLETLIRPVQFFHENMDVYKALDEMRNNHAKYALICDEFGTTQGVVTLRDILEALVGAMPDDYEEPEIIQRQDGSWLVDGQCSFYDFLVFFKLSHLYVKNEYNTISGLILEQLGHIPKAGEIIEWGIFSFEIMDMDGVRIDKVLVNISTGDKD